MKTLIALNWRPLLRTSYQFLIASAVLWAMSRNAGAQLYVTWMPFEDSYKGVVSEYDATTGDGINLGFITAGLDFPVALAVSDTAFFVANQLVGTVSKYNATGEVTNAEFITGLGEPIALAVSGNTLFVANTNTPGTVGKYDATTGAVIKADFITGLNLPGGIAVKGNTVFVSNNEKNSGGTNDAFVGTYDAATGEVINAKFIKGRNHVFLSLAMSGNTLFVMGASRVGKYDATTGAAINPNLITRLNYPSFLAVSGDTLFVADFNGGAVGKYDATTGAVIKADFITGLKLSAGIAVKSAK